MPVPQRVNLIVGWASCPPSNNQNRIQNPKSTIELWILLKASKWLSQL
ncbi:hypothetical protein [Microcoleus sp.]